MARVAHEWCVTTFIGAMTMPGPGAGDTLLAKNFGHENVGLLIFGHLIDQYLISVKFGHCDENLRLQNTAY